MAELKWEDEYSERFDELRKNRVKTSFYKYGSARINYGERLVDALQSADNCVKKYIATGNTEYLLDAANYLMFEYMYPRRKGAFFRATESHESAGIAGIPVNQLIDGA